MLCDFLTGNIEAAHRLAYNASKATPGLAGVPVGVAHNVQVDKPDRTIDIPLAWRTEQMLTFPFVDAVRDAGELDGFEGPAVFELNELPNGAEIQGALTEMTGQRTVPYVFVRSQFIGGGTETMQALESGELLRLLQAE